MELLRKWRKSEPVPEREAIEAHLASCESCQLELIRIQAEPAGRVAQADPGPTGLSDLLSQIRCWESSLPVPELRSLTIRSRAAQELKVFLGGNAAQSALQPVSQDAGNLLPAIQPLLGRFLGRKAASLLSSHIVEVAVVRR